MISLRISSGLLLADFTLSPEVPEDDGYVTVYATPPVAPDVCSTCGRAPQTGDEYVQHGERECPGCRHPRKELTPRTTQE